MFDRQQMFYSTVRNLIYSLAIGLLWTGIYAQHYGNIEMSLKKRMSTSELDFKEFMELDGDSLTLLVSEEVKIKRRVTRMRYLLSTYSVAQPDSFELIGEVVIGIQEYKEEPTYYKMAFANSSGFHLITECVVWTWDRSTKYLLLQTVSRSGEISDIQELASMTYENEKERDFLIRTSENKEKIMVYADISKESEDQSPRMWVFESDFQSFWSTEVSEGLKLKSAFFIHSIKLGNDGEVLLLGHQVKVKLTDEGTEIIDQYSLIRHNERDPVAVLSLKSEEYIVHDLTMDVTPRGQVYLVGFISDYGKVTPDGCVYAIADLREMKFLEEMWTKFDEELLNQFPGGHASTDQPEFEFYAGKQKRLDYFRFMNLQYWESGDIMAIAERRWMYRSAAGYEYHYDELIIFRFDPQGELLWSQVVHKFQHSYDWRRLLGSVWVKQYDNGLHLVYNDNVENIEIRKKQDHIGPVGPSWKETTTGVVACSITLDGELSFREIKNEGFVQALVSPLETFIVTAEREYGVAYILTAEEIALIQLDFE